MEASYLLFLNEMTVGLLPHSISNAYLPANRTAGRSTWIEGTETSSPPAALRFAEVFKKSTNCGAKSSHAPCK